MKRLKKVEYNIFSASVIDLFASALGVFIIFVMILIPKVDKKSKKITTSKVKEKPKVIRINKDGIPHKLKISEINKISFKKNDIAFLHHVNFIGGTNILLPGSKEQLNELANRLINDRYLFLEIRGHTNTTKGFKNINGKIIRYNSLRTSGALYDDVEKKRNYFYKDYSYHLSKYRADKVCDYLTKKGVDSKKLKCIGLANKELIYKFPNQEEAAYNRRVDLKVTRTK
jgi:outer membrane protein OmpA-like peptidoglycan-associated protein